MNQKPVKSVPTTEELVADLKCILARFEPSRYTGDDPYQGVLRPETPADLSLDLRIAAEIMDIQMLGQLPERFPYGYPHDCLDGMLGVYSTPGSCVQVFSPSAYASCACVMEAVLVQKGFQEAYLEELAKRVGAPAALLPLQEEPWSSAPDLVHRCEAALAARISRLG